MAGMNAEHINPFLMATTQMLKDICGFETKIGKPTVKVASFSDETMIIMIGVTGEMKGQVMLAFPENVACEIASKMCMMPIAELDEISKSAICELTNMIMGNAATIFSTKGIGIDITPPTMCTGTVSFSSSVAQNIAIPLNYDADKSLEMHVTIKE